MTTSNQKRNAVEELVSEDLEVPTTDNIAAKNPIDGSSQSRRIQLENLDDNKASLRMEVMSDLTEILAGNQRKS